MSIIDIAKVFGFDEIIKKGVNLIDESFLTDQEKLAKKTEFETFIRTKEYEASKVELEQRAEIIKAEMAQDDKYTKRARPTVFYAGIAIVFLSDIFLPSLAFFLKMPMPELKISDHFWTAWLAIGSVYAGGRTLEKFFKNKQG